MQIELFKYQSENEELLNDIRTVEIDGNLWFVAGDICKILGLTNVAESLKGLDDDEKLVSVVLIAGQRRATSLVSESGLYALIFKSRKESAKDFRKWITNVVIPSIRKKGYYGKIDRSQLPNYIERYKDNLHKIPRTHFSVISEMYIRLFAALENEGYVIPDKSASGKQLMPDISVGKGFANYLKIHNFSAWENAETYRHIFPNKREVDAYMYPIELIPMFIKYIEESWIPKNAVEYFAKRDPVALDYINKLLVGEMKDNKYLNPPLPAVLEMEDKLELFEPNEE